MEDDVRPDYVSEAGQKPIAVDKTSPAAPPQPTVESAGFTDMDFVNGAATKDWGAFQKALGEGKIAQLAK